MKKIAVSFWLLSILLPVGGCAGNEGQENSVEVQELCVQTYGVARYKLFSTQNMWTFIKLDTRTGQIWQVQYSVDGDENRFECDLNPNPIPLADGEEVNGRFELYPTKNMYNFILLDQIDGRTWQVQWSFEEENRAVIFIGKR